MAKDPLTVETSLSAELTEKGIKASAKSRAVAAMDRLVGNVADWINVRLEADTNRRRAITEGEQLLIGKIAKQAGLRIGVDAELAARAIEAHFGEILVGHDNKVGVVKEALEDLSRDPPTDSQSATGGEKLSDAFIDRVGDYARFATTDELRQRWGRVLASEIREPGVFSNKVLRIVDELDQETAELFERLCVKRLDRVIPKAISAELSMLEVATLVGAGLLVEPGFVGKVARSEDISDASGKKLKFWRLGRWGLSIDESAAIRDALLEPQNEGSLGLPVYVLTEEGLAVSSILPDQSRLALDELAQKLSAAASVPPVSVYGLSGSVYRPLASFGG